MSFARSVAICSTILVLVVFAGGAAASHQAGQGSPRDFAVGTGQGDIGRVSFAAHGGAPEPVTGHFHAKGAVFEDVAGEFDLEGPVTCLDVRVNRAGLFYPVRNPDPGEPNGVFVFLEDNGNPASGHPPDRIGFLPVFGELEDPTPPECEPGATPEDLESGNFTIHDSD